MIVSDPSQVVPWVADKVESWFAPQGVAALGWECDGVLTSGVVYDHFTGVSITATIALEPKTTLSRMFLWAIFDYPFNQLGVKKILAYVEESNSKSLTILNRMGFEQEGRIEGVYQGGAMLILTLTKNTCVWLKRLQNGKKEQDSEGT